jgi:hypothetical protein
MHRENFACTLTVQLRGQERDTTLLWNHGSVHEKKKNTPKSKYTK